MSSKSDAVDEFISALSDDDPEQLYQQAPCGYLSTTADGVIVKANQTFLTLSGFGRDELVGRKRFVELLSAGGQIYHETHYAPMLSMHGTAREIALDLVRSDGSRLPVLVNAVLERDADGTPRVIRTAVFDATQRREYERELLRQKQRAEASEARASALARTLQKTFIPPTAPMIPHLDVAARYRPAGDGSEVGGDFYDIFQTGPEEWTISIGDVCGKGVGAAVVTALVRYSLRAVAIQDPSPSHALTALNDALRRHGSDRFCTVAIVRLHRVDGTWTACLSTAGHPLPRHRNRDGLVAEVGEPGQLLGVLDDIVVHDTSLVLQPGEALLLYTDGVTEGRREGSFYGERRLVTVMAERTRSAEALAAGLLEDVLDFQDGSAHDDIAIVAVQVPDTAN